MSELNEQLLPCPFCGGAAKAMDDGHVSCVTEGCGAEVWTLHTDASVRRWNRRATPAPQAAPSDATLAMLEDFVSGMRALGWTDSDFKEMAATLLKSPATLTQTAPSEPASKGCTTDLSRRLRVIAANPVSADMAPLLRADILAAAEEIERYYGGMLNWKATALAERQTPAPAQQAEGDARDAATWREILEAVVREMPKRGNDARNGNAPGHCHDKPGIWDGDNGPLAGTECAWCKTWNKAVAAIASATTSTEGK